MRRILLSLTGVAMVAGALTAPAAAEVAPTSESYLFVVDAERVRIAPGEGDTARIVITGPRATRFTDRPERQAEPIRVRAMLREFGWTPEAPILQASTPNASVSIAGQRSQIVDIKRARVSDGRLVLRVRGLNGPLTAATGTGSVFIDNAVTYPQTQTVAIADSGVEVTLTLQSETDIAVSVSYAGTTYGTNTLAPWRPVVTLTWVVDGEWQNPFEVVFQATYTQDTVVVTSTLTSDGEGELPMPGESATVSFTL